MSVSIYWKMALCLFGTVGLPLRLIGRTEHLLKGCQTVEGARWCHSYRGRCDVAPAGCAGAPNPWRWTSLGAAPQNEAWPRRKEMRSAWRQLCIINRWDHCMSMWNGYGSIPINTIFRGLFTSINPSYFDVHQGTIGFDTLPNDSGNSGGMMILSSSQALFRKRGPVTFSEADLFLAQFFADSKASCFAGSFWWSWSRLQ